MKLVNCFGAFSLELSPEELKDLYCLLDQLGDINRELKADTLVGSHRAREIADSLLGQAVESLHRDRWWARWPSAGFRGGRWEEAEPYVPDVHSGG